MNDKIKKSQKSGSRHWILQRVTAIILVALVIWLAYSFFTILVNPSYSETFFSYISNSLLTILFICISLYHGTLGIQIIIEDYINCKKLRHFLIKLFQIISFLTALAVIIAIIRLHII